MGRTDTKNWFIMPICMAHNSAGGVFTTRAMTVVEIEPLRLRNFSKIEVDSIAAHDPRYQTIYMGRDDAGRSMFQTIYMGEDSATKIV